MAAILALTNLPYLVALFADHGGYVFSGFIYSVDEPMSYLAKMREGYEGAWRYTDPFSTEPHEPALLFVFYLFLGHAARWLGLSLLASYHVARVASSVILILAVNRLLRALSTGQSVNSIFNSGGRLLALILVFLGSGIGWLLRLPFLHLRPMELWFTEAYTFQSMANYPHFALSTALIVLMLADLFLFGRGRVGPWALARLACYSFLQGWIHPRLVLTALAVGAAAAIWGRARHGWELRKWISGLATMLIATLPPAALTLLSVRADPFWTEWSNTPTPSPNPLWVLAGYGLLWPLALYGAWQAIREHSPWGVLIVAWLVVGAILPYLPIPAQRRMIEGLDIPLGILASSAILAWLRPGPGRVLISARAGSWAVAALACSILSLSTIRFIVDGIRVALRPQFPSYTIPAFSEAMDWLKQSGSREDVVLCSMLTGMFVPALTGHRVVEGHWAETLHLKAKQQDATEFFSLGATKARRNEIVKKYGIRYLLITQAEKQYLGLYEPAADDGGWTRAFRGTGVGVYEYLGDKKKD